VILATPERQDLTKLGATLEPGDLDPRIPPDLTAGITIPFPLRDTTTTGPGNPTIRTTYFLSQSVNVGAAAAAATTNIGTVGVGLWRFIVHFAVDSDFTFASPVIAANSVGLNFQSPSGANFPIANRYLQALVTQSLDFVLELLIIDSGWIWNMTTPATGAAQTLSAFATIQATRLL
jgi:hypothetical protein